MHRRFHSLARRAEVQRLGQDEDLTKVDEQTEYIDDSTSMESEVDPQTDDDLCRTDIASSQSSEHPQVLDLTVELTLPHPTSTGA